MGIGFYGALEGTRTPDPLICRKVKNAENWLSKPLILIVVTAFVTNGNE